MDKKKLYTLGLKFKRHQLEFYFDEFSQFLVMGKAKNVKRKFFIGIALILIGLSVTIFITILQLGIAGRLLRYLFLIVIGYGVVESFKQFKLGRANKYRKLISKKSIKIESKEGVYNYLASDIEKFDYQTIRNEEGDGIGPLYFKTTTGEEIQLLKLADKKPLYLDGDFAYLKDFLEETLDTNNN